MKTGFIGTGCMGAALMQGLLTRGGVRAGNIGFFDTDRRKTESLAERLGIKPFSGNLELVREADVIVIAVKPSAVKSVVGEIKGALSPSKLLVSIAAGIDTASIELFAGGGVPVIRAMPSLAASTGSGVTVVCAGKYARGGHMEKAEKMFSSAGDVLRADEEMMDAATAIAGSGPAYVFYLAEALEKAAGDEGFGADVAARLARATVCGAAAVLGNTRNHPGELRRMVSTPGGTTEAAVKILKNGFPELVRKAVSEARKRAAEIGREISTPEQAK